MSNLDTARLLYEAFARADGDAMAALYAPEAHFHDPAFGDLDGRRAGAMWRMLTRGVKKKGSAGLEITFSEPRREGDTVRVDWQARYALLGKVHNHVRATLRFDDNGRIIDHRDKFDLVVWARQAGGPIGPLTSLLVRFAPVRSFLQGRLNQQLDRFIARAKP